MSKIFVGIYIRYITPSRKSYTQIHNRYLYDFTESLDVTDICEKMITLRIEFENYVFHHFTTLPATLMGLMSGVIVKEEEELPTYNIL